MSPNYKIVLLGDSGVEKTSFVKRHLTGQFEEKYNPTMGVNSSNMTFETNYGPIIFQVLDWWIEK